MLSLTHKQMGIRPDSWCWSMTSEGWPPVDHGLEPSKLRSYPMQAKRLPGGQIILIWWCRRSWVWMRLVVLHLMKNIAMSCWVDRDHSVKQVLALRPIKYFNIFLFQGYVTVPALVLPFFLSFQNNIYLLRNTKH